jgi:UDP-N-acetylmuramoyl-tripeptide--D-alanyl-D-alanine ligase
MATPIPSNRAKFTVEELVRATGGKLVNVSVSHVEGVSTDTRQITPGAVFVALRGERFDAHDFVPAALQAGATVAIVERELPLPIGQLVVPDSLSALGELAAHHRRRWGGAVLAIAGAAGKTTTRTIVSAVLTTVCGEAAHSTVGNLNNRIGVPMVLLGLTESHRVAAVEVGTNQTGEVPLLTAVVKPDVAILTLVDIEHSEGLGDLDAIEVEEGAIFSDSCHTFVVNADDERALRQASEKSRARADKPPQVVGYGFGDRATLRGVSRKPARDGTELRVVSHERELTVRVPIVGKPACYAVMAAMAGVEALLQRRLTANEVHTALSQPSLAPEGRAELLTGPNGVLILNDSYNANPASMRSAVETASELAQERGGGLHLVLGEMRELGALSHASHAELGQYLTQHVWASLFAVGTQMTPLVDVVARRLPEADRWVALHPSANGIAEHLRGRLRPSDVLLVKGSRGVRTETVIAELLSEKNP